MDKMYFFIERLGQLLRSDLRKAAYEEGLQPIHLQVMEYLMQANRFSNTSSALKAFLNLTKGTLSQTLKVMEEKGLIRKEVDPLDRRIQHLFLTSKGKKLLQRLVPPPAWRRTEAVLDKAIVAPGEEILERLLRSLQEANGFHTFGPCYTCRHLIQESEHRYRCGLTNEPLKEKETRQICYEHAYPG
ncbi:MAG: MarR family transcriptional regulator [Gammaproteobacteria bacterium]|nr:MAG: MarR family transcriptional regulator [Gammaproteobacteria bacterium]